MEFSLTEAAELLGKTEDDIFRYITKHTPLLIPSVVFPEKVLLHNCVGGSPAWESGCFDVRGAEELKAWSEWGLNLHMVTLVKGEDQFLYYDEEDVPTPELRPRVIRLEELVLTQVRLEEFAKSIGIKLELGSATTMDQEAQEELVSRLKAEGFKDNHIAKELQRRFPTISTFRVGSLLPANPGANISPGSISKRGRRLLK
ncbi:hypothetical protein KP005_19395 [Geomonas nitrogeniifigens]|uniref:Uncharacterized protein n=1 Tax=Geomonas diazotrophica TaxID=2843197 RepID=A0ABX8JGM2_9BACT|nr:hypothetical protein [Geomonas nitrogeniifigens]QWV97473.1 hypothetical protein KP005_19395 [Geomonas nitrogeniifigens]